MPYISDIYLIGLVINLVRLGRGWVNLIRVRRSIIASDYQELLERLTAAIGVDKLLKVSYSGLIDISCVMGLTKPSKP